MQGERVLVLDDDMPAETREVLKEACTHACMSAEFQRASELEETALAPSLLVAALPSGQRNVPQWLRSLATDRFPISPLLLLCDEPVVGDVLSLQHGRLTLLGAPHSAVSISSRLRLAATPVDGQAPKRLPIQGVDGSSGLVVQEHRHESWWGGWVTVEDDACPYEFHSKGSGFSIGETSSLTGVSPLRFDLHAIEGQWSFYASEIPGVCTLFSKRRVPPVWDIRGSFERGLGPAHRMSAVTGDLFLFVIPCLATPDLSEQSWGGETWTRYAQDGGPALLDSVVRAMQETGELAHVLVGEVR